MADLQFVATMTEQTAGRLFALLSQGGEEWRSKVGVAGPRDGSAKSTTRLLEHQGWVFKTNLSWIETSEAAALDVAATAAARERALGLWHPDKLWFTLRKAHGFLPMSACPRLTTLRALTDPRERLASWGELLAFSVRAFREREVGLDLNPANFARERADGPLFYVDDETAGILSLSDLASFLVARIPEEPSLSPEDFDELGRSLQGVLATMCGSPSAWLALVQALEDYPLLEAFHARRRALAAGLLDGNRAAKVAPGRRVESRVTCVLADVHANLPALEAVLRASEDAGADSYLFLGDAVGYGPHPAACVRRLAELPNALHVRGNHDHAVAHGHWEGGANLLARECVAWTRACLSEGELAWLRELRAEVRTDEWWALHGAPKDPHRFVAYVYELTYEENMDVLRKSGQRVCFYGHTHVQYVHGFALGQTQKLGAPQRIAIHPRDHLLVNPGSVGQPRDGVCSAAYALWNRSDNTIHLKRAFYDVERTLRDLHAFGLPAKLAERLSLGR